MTTPAKPSAMPWQLRTGAYCTPFEIINETTCIGQFFREHEDDEEIGKVNAELAVAAVNALHAIAPGRELEAAKQLESIFTALRAGLLEDARTQVELLDMKS